MSLKLILARLFCIFEYLYEYLIFFKLSLFMNFWKYHTSITHIDTYEHTNTETS